MDLPHLVSCRWSMLTLPWGGIRHIMNHPSIMNCSYKHGLMENTSSQERWSCYETSDMEFKSIFIILI